MLSRHSQISNITELKLSVRSANWLRRNEVVTIGDLVQKSEADLQRLPSFERKSLNEIKETTRNGKPHHQLLFRSVADGNVGSRMRCGVTAPASSSLVLRTWARAPGLRWHRSPRTVSASSSTSWSSGLAVPTCRMRVLPAVRTALAWLWNTSPMANSASLASASAPAP